MLTPCVPRAKMTTIIPADAAKKQCTTHSLKGSQHDARQQVARFPAADGLRRGAPAYHGSVTDPCAQGFGEFFGNLYHLNTEEEPENADYPKNPELRQRLGPRGVIKSTAATSATSSRSSMSSASPRIPLLSIRPTTAPRSSPGRMVARHTSGVRRTLTGKGATAYQP
jgi:hypothetical protein